MVDLWGAVTHLMTEGGVEYAKVPRMMVGDSKAEGEEKWGGVDAKGASW